MDSNSGYPIQHPIIHRLLLESLCADTFCTVISFEQVINAIGEFAFIESELPVIVSLEMHCSTQQQVIVSLEPCRLKCIL